MTPLLMRLSKLVFVGWSISMQSHRRVLLKTFSSMQQKTIYLFGTTNTKIRLSTAFHLLSRSLFLTLLITHTQQVICSTTDLFIQPPLVVMSAKLEALEPLRLVVLIACFLRQFNTFHIMSSRLKELLLLVNKFLTMHIHLLMITGSINCLASLELTLEKFRGDPLSFSTQRPCHTK